MSTTAVVRGPTTPTTIRPIATTATATTTSHKICPPQIFVLPPNMFVSGLGNVSNSNKVFVGSLNNNNSNMNNGVRTLMNVGNSFQKRQVQVDICLITLKRVLGDIMN
jgi:hypothetical protein